MIEQSSKAQAPTVYDLKKALRTRDGDYYALIDECQSVEYNARPFFPGIRCLAGEPESSLHCSKPTDR